MRYEDIPNARVEFNCGQVETLAGLNVVRQANKILLNQNVPPPAWRRFGYVEPNNVQTSDQQ